MIKNGSEYALYNAVKVTAFSAINMEIKWLSNSCFPVSIMMQRYLSLLLYLLHTLALTKYVFTM